MDTTDISPLIEDLTSNIDDLGESLAPLLNGPLSHQTSKLPLLDQAKLYVLATYAIESILFSSLRVHGVDAKAHPVFQELGRVKEYFGKIKTAEAAGAGAKRNISLDREAAGRFIKAGLAGNERYDQERADRVARERAGAKRKLEEMSVGTHTRFDGAAKKIKAQDSRNRQKEGTAEGAGGTVDDAASGDAERNDQQQGGKKHGRRKPEAMSRLVPQPAEFASQDEAERALEDVEDEMSDAGSLNGKVDSGAAQAREKADSKKAKKPKNSKEALSGLLDSALDGGHGKNDSKRQRKKKKRKS